MKNLLLALALIIARPVHADDFLFRGTLYEIGSNRQKVLFKMSVTERTEGPVKIQHSSFVDPSGKEVVAEDTRARDGKAERYEVKNFQTGDHGFIEARAGKLYFEYTRGGETKKDDESLADNFIVAPTTVPFLQKNWAKILSGDTVDSRFGVPERKETVGFKFFKVGETETQGVKATIVRMKPSSFVIAAIVKPLQFTLDSKDGRLLELTGRTLPKVKDGDSWKDLDADIVYSWEKAK